jgi:hypothetical protein
LLNTRPPFSVPKFSRWVRSRPTSSVAHGHAAQLAAIEGLTTAALQHVTAAREHAQSTPAIASWLATIEATIHADLSDYAAARNAIDRAQSAADQTGGRPAPASFRHHGTTQLTAATGRILLSTGDHSRAREVLTAAAGDSRPIGRRQRVLILVDLAAAELHIGDLAAACSQSPRLPTSCSRLPTGLVPLVSARSAPAHSGLWMAEPSVPWMNASPGSPLNIAA